jgi:ABC-type nitrate/sulfonate/bicarbonate transport system substrate-binding protein
VEDALMKSLYRKFSMRLIAAIALVFVSVIGAIGATQAADTIRMALLTQPGIWDAGLFAAVDRKYFADENIEVSFISPATPADGVRLAASGGAEVATAHSTEVITARARGLPVVSIATNHQFGTAGIMVPGSDVKSLKQLEGKNVGVTGIPFNKVMLEYSLAKSGVDVSKVNIVTVGFAPMPLLLSKRIDALGDAITWSEPAMYNSQIKKPAGDKSTYSYFAFYENGVPRYYTLGVVVNEDAVAKNPELYRRFLRAWTKGLDWAINNQQAAVDGMLKRHPELNKEESLANLAEIARISQSPDTQKNGLGWQNPEIWAAQEEFMREQKLIDTKVDVSKAVRNDLLPKP